MVYLLAGIICVHLAWAFFNTLAVNSTLFINNYSRVITLLVNWIIPVGGPAITLLVLRSINPKVNSGNLVADGSGSSNLYSGNEGSDSGGGCSD